MTYLRRLIQSCLLLLIAIFGVGGIRRTGGLVAGGLSRERAFPNGPIS